MANKDSDPDSISTQVRRIVEISQMMFGSEDDLIDKIVLPFFQVIGYGPDSFQLKFPVSGYRPDRPGRKPEADCVFFSALPHESTSSLLVAEVKRDDPQFPEQQARFYSTNLCAPFYVAWSGLAFEVWQVQNFRPPSLIGRYRLEEIDSVSLSELKELLAPDKILQFCEKNEIKKFDHDDQRKTVEARYLSHLAADLRSFKSLDLPQIRDLDTHYVELHLRECDLVPSRVAQEAIQLGTHPGELIEFASSGKKTFSVFDLLETTSAIAIIGDPGAGKTTLIRHLCLDNAYADSRIVPILVSIRELLSAAETLVESALRQIKRYGNSDNPVYLYEAALAQGRVLFCVDGIDELGIDEPKDARASLVRFSADLSNILSRHHGNKVVITARRESWPVCRPILSQSLREFEVLPFNPRAVRIFVSKWFAESSEDADRIIDALRVRGWPSYARNPLLLTLTCACLPMQGEIPQRASELYSRFFRFMLDQWHITRVSGRPRLPNFDPDAILSILGEVALGMHIQRRAASAEPDIINFLAPHVSLLGEPLSKPRNVFLELTKQHGVLRSWSIDQYYAFPHLSFQAYFTATSLRSRSDGHRIIFEHRHDPFWREAMILYSELGDITNLARDLLNTTENILRSEVLLLAECWAAGGQISDSDLAHTTIERLTALTKGDNVYLADKTVRLLARIPHPEAKRAISSMICDASDNLLGGPASRFAVSVFGEDILPQVIAELVRTGHDENLLENFSCLRRRTAVEQLYALILRTDFPRDWNAGVRHLRRGAARIMAEVGQDIALGPLLELLSAAMLSNFEKRGCVSALAAIDDPRIAQARLEIMTGDFPMDCRTEAAGDLAPDEPDARRFLLRVMSDEAEDYFDRRDAAGELANFKLTDDDLASFRTLIFDPAPHFVGGSNVAISTVGKIGTKASRELLEEALVFWEKSSYPEALKVREAILQALRLEDKTADLREILEIAGLDRWINTQLPAVALEYIRREPEKANELFISALRSYARNEIYAGTLAGAVLRILPRIPLNDVLLEAAVDLAVRLPGSISAWNAIARTWQRHDLSVHQRALFQLRGSSNPE
jgi:NACHT domain